MGCRRRRMSLCRTALNHNNEDHDDDDDDSDGDDGDDGDDDDDDDDDDDNLFYLGFESVSIKRGQRLPKYLALSSKKSIATRFKTATGCPFTVRILLREYPPNIITPSDRDVRRNACPIHANLRSVKPSEKNI